MLELIRDKIRKAIQVAPSLFDHRLLSGLDRLAINTPSNFIASRSYRHLRAILLVQFFLQCRIESVLAKKMRDQKTLFLKLFSSTSKMCCSVIFLSSYGFNQEQILNTFHALLPGSQEIPFSFYTWYHPELSYQFCYIELEKLRGKSLSTKELRLIEMALREQLLAVPPLTPALFWPYNEEESFRQIQLLHREIQSPNELPHISLLFQEQTVTSLEFLVHYARPYSPANLYSEYLKSGEFGKEAPQNRAVEGVTIAQEQGASEQPDFVEQPTEPKLQISSTRSIDQALKQLPHYAFWHFKKIISLPFVIELGAFSVKIPSFIFDTRGSINLLYARRYLAKCLESLFGPFRDYNGGLFEKQQEYFESIRLNLSDKIPLFDLFAEKVFYSLHPVEARFSLGLKHAENLLMAFAELLQTKTTHAIVKKENVIVVKNGKETEEYPPYFKDLSDASEIQAHLTLGGADYTCYLGSRLPNVFTKNRLHKQQIKTLRLSLQEGAPPSLNPHFSSGDMRCRILSKLLFDGLMRLNAEGEPEPAGALEYSLSDNGLEYIFKLRSCFWSNGEKVTAIDYVASWQRALKDPVSHPEQLFIIKNGRLFKEGKIDPFNLGIRALDPLTLKITLEHPDPRFLHKLAQPFFFPLFGPMREPKWFNGPYLTRHQTKEGLTLERNPYYWEAHRIFFEQIEIKWENDVYKIYQLFQEGRTDWIGDPTSTLSLALIQDLAQQRRLLSRKVDRRFLVHFNTRLPHLSVPQIRHALSLAIERSFICATIFPQGIAIPDPVSFEQEAAFLFEEGLHKLKLTKQMFPEIKFLYSHQTGRENLALYLQLAWEKKLGIRIHLEKIEWNLFRNKLEHGDFEITATIQETLDNFPLEFLDRCEGPSSWNFSRWEHPSYRHWLNQAREMKNTQDQTTLLKKAEAILCEEMPFSPLFRCMHFFAHHPLLKNYFFDAEGCVDFSKAYMEGDPL